MQDEVENADGYCRFDQNEEPIQAGLFVPSGPNGGSSPPSNLSGNDVIAEHTDDQTREPKLFNRHHSLPSLQARHDATLQDYA